MSARFAQMMLCAHPRYGRVHCAGPLFIKNVSINGIETRSHSTTSNKPRTQRVTSNGDVLDATLTSLKRLPLITAGVAKNSVPALQAKLYLRTLAVRPVRNRGLPALTHAFCNATQDLVRPATLWGQPRAVFAARTHHRNCAEKQIMSTAKAVERFAAIYFHVANTCAPSLVTRASAAIAMLQWKHDVSVAARRRTSNVL